MRISTKKYIDNQVMWLRREKNAKLKSINQKINKMESNNATAINKVENTYSDYRAQQNEWRGQIKDQTNTFVTRRELWGAVITTITILLAAIALLYKIKPN